MEIPRDDKTVYSAPKSRSNSGVPGVLGNLTTLALLGLLVRLGLGLGTSAAVWDSSPQNRHHDHRSLASTHDSDCPTQLFHFNFFPLISRETSDFPLIDQFGQPLPQENKETIQSFLPN